MLKMCLAFWKSEPQYAYKRYAYKKTCITPVNHNNSLKELVTISPHLLNQNTLKCYNLRIVARKICKQCI